jgi:hypothetical protein
MKTNPLFLWAGILMLFACNQSAPSANSVVFKKESANNQLASESENNKTSSQIPVGLVADSAAMSNDQADEPPQKNKPPETKNDPVLTKTDWDKKIIKTANLRLEVKDYNGYNEQLHKIIRNFGGYIASEEQTKDQYQLLNTVVLKVPADKFDDLVNSLPLKDTKIMERKISSEDVSTEYVDTKARLEARKQVRNKYLDLLKQAKNIDEILQVQGEINSIQEEIESASGRIQYLSRSAAYSTVNLSFYQLMDGASNDDINPGFFTKLSGAFKNGMDMVAAIMLSLASIWPLIIIVVMAWLLLKRKMKKRPASV